MANRSRANDEIIIQRSIGAPYRARGTVCWRAHHEARRGELNQPEFCETKGVPAFGDWRTKFKAKPQPLARKLRYRRGRS